MDIKAIKQQALAGLDAPELSTLGVRTQLEQYLREEFRELDLSKKWADVESHVVLSDNPNNILLWHLLGKAPAPKVLSHKFSGGDYPDVDMDFEPEKRDIIKNMLRQKFGESNCMEVSTYGGTHVKGAIQDLARISGLDPQEVFKITTTIDYNVNNDEENKLDWILEHNVKVEEFLSNHPKIKDWVEKMQEVKRSIGKHASAYIITNRPIAEYIPVVLDKEKEPITGYTESSSVKSLNEVGLVKFDLLGLENLTVIRETLELIEQRRGVTVDWDVIDINDPDVYRILRQGFNGGIFQIDSPLSAMIVSTIKPTAFEDLSAINALIRPSCLAVKAHEFYRDHKQGKFDPTSYPVWTELKDKINPFTYKMLDRTYGIVIYQEQTMAMLAEFCGITFDETNKMRKIIGIPANKKLKEHHDYIADKRKQWMDYAGNKFGERLAVQWWDTAVGSLSYGFNASHSISYAMIAFRQLYLKAKFPQEFYAALLKHTKAEENLGRSRLMKFIVEAKHLGVHVESPHVNLSGEDLSYAADGKSIYVGFRQIKGIGDAASKDILGRAPYTSFDDFVIKHKKGALGPDGKELGRSGVNKTAINALLYTNAFRDFGDRTELIVKYENSLLPKKKQHEWVHIPTRMEILRAERDALTIVLSETNPIKMPYGFMTITKALDTVSGRICKVKGILDKISWHTSKVGNAYARLVINDFENSMIVLVWKNMHGKVKKLSEGDIIEMSVKHLDGETFSAVSFISSEKQDA